MGRKRGQVSDRKAEQFGVSVASVYILSFFVFGMLVTGAGVCLAQEQAPSGISGESGFQGAGVYVRPATKSLLENMVGGFSTISRQSRRVLADIARDMDRHVASVYTGSGLEFSLEADTVQWIRDNTVTLPRRTPLPERAILAFLQVQIGMLDRVLTSRNAGVAARLRKSRSMISVAGEDKRVFHDFRDNFIFMILYRLHDIDKLATRLGAREDRPLVFPTHATNMKEVEKFIISEFNATFDMTREILITNGQ